MDIAYNALCWGIGVITTLMTLWAMHGFTAICH
jgi:hypothetical protein